MNKAMGPVFLVVGICLLAYGFSAADSVASDFSRLFNGTPTNRSIALLVLGSIFTVLGALSFTKKG